MTDTQTSRLPRIFGALFLMPLVCAIGCGRSPWNDDVQPTEEIQTSHELQHEQSASSPTNREVANAAATDHKSTAEVNLGDEQRSEWPVAPSNGAALRAESQAFFDELVERVPNSPDSFEVKARYHFLVGETKAAKQCWETALSLHRDYAFAWQGLGQVAMLNAEVDTAVDCFKKAIALQQDNPEMIHNLADAYLRQAKIQEAIELLKNASQKVPRSAATWLRLGQAFMADLKFANARDAFERALELSPELPQAQQGLGSALLRLGNRVEAQKLLAAQKSKRVVVAIQSEAELFADECTEISKRYRYASKVYLSAGDPQRCELALQRAAVLQPDSEEVWGELVGLYVANNRLPKAIATGREMCRVAPDNPSFHFTLGVLYRKSSDPKKAAAQFEEVIRLAPSSAMGYEALARLSIDTSTNLDRCILLAQNCVNFRGTAADYELLAQAYAVNQKYLEAKTSLQKAIDFDPKNEAYRQAMAQLMRVIEPKQKSR